MGSAIRPYPGAHRFSFLQVTYFCKAPASSTHQNFIFGFLLTPSRRSGGPKYAPPCGGCEMGVGVCNVHGGECALCIV